MSEEQPIQNDLEKKVIELEKKLNELIINKGMRENEEEKPKRKNKTPQYIIDANKRYYQKKKNNLDFRLKIRERNKKARERKTNQSVTTKSNNIVNTEPIIKMLNKPITISFYDDNDDIGF